MFRARGAFAAGCALLGACVLAAPAQAGPADDVSLVMDIAPSAPESTPQGFAALGDRVIFSATPTGGGTGREPWVTDGTAAGTQLLGDLLPGAAGSLDGMTLDFHAFKGHVYFAADGGPGIGTELFRTDGTPGGTGLFVDPGLAGDDDSNPAEFETMGDHLYFSAEGASTQGTELWRTNGAPGNAELVKEIFPGAAGSLPAGVTAFDGSLYFSAADQTLGREIFKSDGVPGGSTTMLRDINPNAASSDAGGFTEHASRLFFVAFRAADGAELWSTDGTSIGTEIVENIAPGADGSYPAELTSVGANLYFATFSRAGFTDRELWRSDGTPAGTDEVADIGAANTSSNPTSLTAFKDQVFFAASGPNGNELWASDGTAAGTREVANISGLSSSSPFLGDAVNRFLYFTATQMNITGSELWRTDGTTAGTALVEDYNPGPGDGAESFVPPFAFDGGVLLTASNGVHGRELVRADDTTAPDTTITSGPAEASASDDTTPTFTFTADESPATFECSVDRAAFAVCSGPADSHTTAVLAPGTHTFSVRATDPVGLVDPTPALTNFNIADVPDEGDLPDTSVLDPFAKAKSPQRPKDELIVKVKVGAGEPVRYVAKGKATVNGEKRGVKLVRQTGAVEAGKRVKVKLKAARSDAGDEVLEAIADGEKVKAALRIKLVDKAGNVFKKKLTVKLK